MTRIRPAAGLPDPRRRRTRLAALLGAWLIAAASLGVPALDAAGPIGAGPPSGDRLHPDLVEVLGHADPGDEISVIVHFPDERRVAGQGPNRGRATIEALRAAADRSQMGLRPQLDHWRLSGELRRYTRLWVRNAVAVTARPAVVRALAHLPGVVTVVPDRVFTLEASQPAQQTQPAAVAAEPNIDLIGAPSLWSLGVRGSGVVVGSMDTGVDVGHPELAATWRGGSNSWYDPNGQHPSAPVDVNGHGTWTTGLMVAGDAGGSAIGVAPDARWIAVKLFSDADTATTSGVHLGLQWLMDPDGNPATDDGADVVNNSWVAGPGCDLEFEPDLSALVAAGIVPVFAAGNGGPDAETVDTPASNPSAFAVGASDGTTIASFSGRGPTMCGRTEPAIVPHVVAPGVDIRTIDRFGLYTTASGTSMSTPQVSGGIALLRGAFPSASVTELESALMGGATDLDAPGPDHAAGYGRIDLLAAYQLLGGDPGPTPSSGPTPTPAPTPTPTPTPTPADVTGPVVSGLATAPSTTSGGDVAVSATIDDRLRGGSPVVAAEAFIDVLGAPGAGIPLIGPFGGPLVAVAGSMPSALLAGLPDGNHRVFVRGRDGPAGWGPAAETSLVIDRVPPSGTVAIAAGAAYTATTSVAITVAATDPGSAVVQLALSNDGATWSARPYAPSVGWTLAAVNGPTTVWAKWRDGAGNWSAATADTIVVDTVAPTVAVPLRSMSAGTALSAGRVPVKLAWSGSDATAGVARYELREQVDSGTWATVSTAVASPSSWRALTAGHTYRYAVRAIDRAGNLGVWAYGATFRVTAYSEAHGAIHYSGTWSTASGASYWGGKAKAASAAGARATFAVTGRSVAWIALKSPTRGKATVYVGGVAVTTVDLYSPTWQAQQVVWTANWSTSATRTVVIRVSGTPGRPRVDVDGLVLVQ